MRLDEPHKHRSALREFLAVDNLRHALALSVIVTALAVPRIVVAGYDPFSYIPAALLSMTLVCGAITAWKGGSGGFRELLPERGLLLRGLGIALVLGLPFGLLKAHFIDPMLEHSMGIHLPPDTVDLHFPKDGYGVLALVLWVAGFETMFFEGGTMSMWMRISGRIWVATLVTVALRFTVILVQLSQIDLGRFLFPTLLAYLVAQIVACQLFVRAGLFPVMLYNAALQVGLLLALF